MEKLVNRFKEKNMILKVAAIVMIGVNGLTLLSSLIMFAGSAELNAKAEALGIDGVPMSMYMTAIFGALIYVVIGILGLFAEKRRTLLAAGIAVMALCVLGILYNIVRSGFIASYLLGIVVPAVFLYGAYKQPAEEGQAEGEVQI